MVKPWHDDNLKADDFMIDAATLAFRDILSPPFRGVLVKSLALTIGLFIALWLGLEWFIVHVVVTPWPWLDTFLDILTGVGLVIALGFLVAPVAALFVGLFLDDIAETVEREHFPHHPPGRAQPTAHSIGLALRFFFVVAAVNIAALFLLLVPGVNLIAFYVGNGYLLGREYFELAAMRHITPAQARALRKANRGKVFIAGLIIAGLASVPILNFLTPLFGTGFMVRVFKELAARAGLAPIARTV